LVLWSLSSTGSGAGQVYMSDVVEWLLDSDEPWTRYRVLVDLLDRPEDDDEVQAARAEMTAHPLVCGLIERAATWPGYSLKRHNDAGHPIYAASTLADLGLRAGDVGMADVAEAVLAHQSPEGAFQTMVNIPQAFGGAGEDAWTWIACDAPTLLYALFAWGLGDDARVQRAAEHLEGLAEENGWRCSTSPDLGKFKGPGRRADPCPIANVYALKALSLVPSLVDSPATRAGTEMLLWHWAHQKGRKLYLFGIGTDFRKLKYPYVWYDILHVADVLSRFPFVRSDSRMSEMVEAIAGQAGVEGRYTATSMYRAWKGWSFSDKKQPSPWLTFLALRICRRIQEALSATQP
jgi:hypothetical protein